MAIIGPGAVQENQIAPHATLDGASEYEYVTILNPLTDDFAIRVAQDVPVNMPFSIGHDTSGRTTQATITERDAIQTYGLQLKNKDFQGRKHISNDTVIKSGKTINLKGSEAQVAVRQLVNELMQREGNGRMLADPFLRAAAEARIVIARGSIQDLMDGNVQTPRSQIDEALAASNKANEVVDEPAFPGVTQTATGAETIADEVGSADYADSTPAKRSPGRPAKA